jgi:hypothetical protein
MAQILIFKEPHIFVAYLILTTSERLLALIHIYFEDLKVCFYFFILFQIFFSFAIECFNEGILELFIAISIRVDLLSYKLT